MTERLYLLRIALSDIEPEIWRRFVVPADIPLDRLHDVIQIVMGWEEYHMHQFTIADNNYLELPEPGEEGLDEGLYCLGDLVKQKGRTFTYMYDFGDSWQHEITLEDSNYKNEDLQLPVECVDGARACPPEDIGGIPGYENFCAALKGSKPEDNEECLEWCDVNYDTEDFDVAEVNYKLLKYLRWSRQRHIVWGCIA